MLRRVLRLLTLPRAERRLVLRAVAIYARVWWRLWQHGLAGAQGLQITPSQIDRGSTPPAVPARRAARLVAGALRPFGANCLGESLTLVVLLQRLAYPASLRIGARRAAAGLEAHAWVELDGMPLNDRPDIAADYAPFERAEAETRFV